ncbi:MAG: hypothetical protein MK179_21825 [Pirellulaceae bacterium]|nr:hypothetical protein [Pirellulaceae bacterium]
MRIALVKQEVYQDLYVCPAGTSCPQELLFSSMGRVGPVGLFTLLGADFYIVREDKSTECQVYRRVLPELADRVKLLKHRCLNEIPGRDFFRPGNQLIQGDCAVDCDSVRWGDYDIVISLNVSLPKRLVRENPQTLFCYMIGEANLAKRKVQYGYDVCLNQEARGRIAVRPGVIDCPYTFVGPRCLERILTKRLDRQSHHSGVYAEINSCEERPVKTVPDVYRPLQELGHPIRLHQQLIEDNLTQVFDAKYFLKLGGRHIRGNSVIEAISAGTLVLMSPHDVTHHELLPPETWVHNAEEAIERIRFLDSQPHVYADWLQMQRSLLQQYVTTCPLISLQNSLAYKRRRAPQITQVGVPSVS